ncbi:hypothetical protein SPRG_07035 [Saprolegnia parasitica CBS 223.65]|uniref:Uncharacterized protein n=1 Tax=Saprolegnia parasitica (strain CBS 223.65) TaxID=695850 RepID=A0A067CKW8_SAPPC|nr:hypothetical protein SPRG_07035 [Saprolegnia parasitica CBS 223.65]KDO27447.1 hypothetical protein SPRG_07035 [Saprolegnia parasitica CBS 223.65]|eukprot:XP_012201886.1 hypothetical protein SPRG_07035 [Saprolegnia parasitica CBS 223.65]
MSDANDMRSHLRALPHDLWIILGSHHARCVLLISSLTSFGAYALAKYYRDTAAIDAFPAHTIWLLLTRLGDVVLVGYPWLLSQPRAARSLYCRGWYVCLVGAELASELVYLAAPPNKHLWESPRHTTSLFKVLVTVHFALYFAVMYLYPYYATSGRRNSTVAACGPPLQAISAALPSPRPLADISCLPRFLARLGQPQLAGYDVMLYSAASMVLPYLEPSINLIAVGPVFFVHVLLALGTRSQWHASRSRGFCLLFTSFQMCIHALPTFVIENLYGRNGNGSSKSVFATLAYYVLMGTYGHLWRLVARYATYMAFTGTHRFDGVYGLLLLLTFGRIFTRDSKCLNDLGTWLLCAYLGKASAPILERAHVQCSRLLKARQNMVLNLASSLIIPSLFVLEISLRWHVLSPSIAKMSMSFVLYSALAQFLTRLAGGASAWVYLRHRAATLGHELPKEAALPLVRPSTMLPAMNAYWATHATYLYVCVGYGAMSAIMLLGKLYLQLDIDVDASMRQ